MSDEIKTEIGQLGEFGLIDRLTKNIKLKHASSEKGVGDDAAVIDYKGNKTLVSTDLLMEGIHFDLTYTPLKHLGYKAVVVNVSDIYAMNGTPRQITISLGISSKMSVESLDEFYEGVYAACEVYDVDLVGGDTTSSLTGFTISVTALGEAPVEKIVGRDGARKNDLICVTGDFGSAYMGLQLLEREKQVFNDGMGAQPDLTGYDHLLKKILKPEARKDIVELLDKISVVPSSMIDVSDGISSEVMHLCAKSKKGCRVYEDKLPINAETSKIAEEMGINPIVAALNGGEDYELMFTISTEDFDRFQKEMNADLYVIGYITDEDKGCYLVTNADQEVELQAQGWNPIKKDLDIDEK